MSAKAFSVDWKCHKISRALPQPMEKVDREIIKMQRQTNKKSVKQLLYTKKSLYVAGLKHGLP